MKKVMVLFLLLLLPNLLLAEGKEGANAIREVVEYFVDEQDQNWRVTLSPNGEIWGWQFDKSDKNVTWDFGAHVLMEIARGHGHRIWFGVTYRQSAGFSDTQSITPFDPRHIDTAQNLFWRWAIKPRRTVFTTISRWCFHEQDVKNRSAVFYTVLGAGFGTISPGEEGEGPRYFWLKEKPGFDFYFRGGPIAHGGPSRIFGHSDEYQGEGKLYTTFTHPISNHWLVELRGTAELQLLYERALKKERYRADGRLAFVSQRENGSFSVFIGRHFYDDFIFRRSPVGYYFGISHRF